MESVIIIHYAEIALKGKNRRDFEEKLIENIKKAFKNLPYKSIKRISGRILIYLRDDAESREFSCAWFDGFDKLTAGKLTTGLMHVFSIANFSFAWKVEADLKIIEKSLVEILRKYLQEKFTPSKIKEPIKTFRITTKRADKKFPLTSEEINKRVGEYILKNFQFSIFPKGSQRVGTYGAGNFQLEVDLENPDINCFIEIVEGKALLYFEKIKGLGGLPVGISGKVVSLISSGFDSPVAAWRMLKRGARVIFVHFHSFPRTNRASIDNVKNLVKTLTSFQFKSILYLVPFFEIQKEILTKTPTNYRIILYRRMMFRIAERVAQQNNAKALVTGESLGQVASQTLENINVIGSVVNLPVFRPLIGMDKEEIIAEAKKIGTYEISKLPYQDCCSLFVPRHPATKAKMDKVLDAERNLDIEVLIKSALEKIEKITLTF